jgi:hypothetical protein
MKISCPSPQKELFPPSLDMTFKCRRFDCSVGVLETVVSREQDVMSLSAGSWLLCSEDAVWERQENELKFVSRMSVAKMPTKERDVTEQRHGIWPCRSAQTVCVKMWNHVGLVYRFILMM